MRCFLVLVMTTLALGGCTSIVEDPVKDAVKENVTRPIVKEASQRASGWSGEWSGTWKDPGGKEHPAHASLVQNGLTVDGVLILEDNPCMPTANLHAEVNDEGLDAKLNAGGAELEYKASIFDGQDQSGELTLIHPALCAVETGTKALVSLHKN